MALDCASLAPSASLSTGTCIIGNSPAVCAAVNSGRSHSPDAVLAMGKRVSVKAVPVAANIRRETSARPLPLK